MRGVFCVTGLLLLASGALAEVMPLPGDLIVDAFDDPVSFDFPIRAGEPNFVVQDGVGPLGATRRVDVSDGRTRARGQLVIGDSLLRATVTGADPFAATSPTLTGHVYNLIYDLSSPVDLAAAGLDAIAVDFRAADSSFGFIPRVTMFTQGVDFPGQSYASERFRTPLSDSPFTLLFPLEEFTLRGGGGRRAADHPVSSLAVDQR